MPAGEFAGAAGGGLGQVETGRVQGEDFLRPNGPQSRPDRVNPTWFRSECSSWAVGESLNCGRP